MEDSIRYDIIYVYIVITLVGMTESNYWVLYVYNMCLYCTVKLSTYVMYIIAIINECVIV